VTCASVGAQAEPEETTHSFDARPRALPDTMLQMLGRRGAAAGAAGLASLPGVAECRAPSTSQHSAGSLREPKVRHLHSSKRRAECLQPRWWRRAYATDSQAAIFPS
jgi:hypothetical protein